MSNVIPLHTDYLRWAFELTESLNDTRLSKRQQEVVEQVLSCLEKQIELNVRKLNASRPG
ncbi:TPA: hypothetical protein ACTW8Y_000478 [Raoultella ornithinolytica]